MLNWSKKKVTTWYVISHIVLFLLLFVAPIITITINYEIKFDDATSIALMGKCLLLGFFIFGALKVKKVANKWPKGKFKYTIFMLFSLALIGVMFFLVYLFESNVELASLTVKICLCFIAAATLLNGLFIVYLDDVVYLDEKAKEKTLIEERAAKIGK